MNKKLIKSLKTIILLAILASSNVFAVGVWSPAGKIVQFYPYTTGALLIKVDGVNPGSLGCDNNNYFLLDPLDDGFDIMFSTALSAHHAGIDIQVYYREYDCSGNDNSTTGFPVITHLRSFQ